MPCKVLIGSQWGDEGKAKAIDFLCEDSEYIVRYQGGANAGHTVIFQGEKFVFHLLPSGILHKEVFCVISNGVVLDPEVLLNEIQSLDSFDLNIDQRLFISSQCHVVMPYHKLLDQYAEERLKEKKIGTTKRGIGPCYSDKSSRGGIRLIDLYDSNLKEILKTQLEEKNFLFEHYYQKKPLSLNKVYESTLAYAEKLKDYVCNTSYLLNQALKEEKHILCEGAQGTLLDIDFGTYPYVTSSNSISAGVCTGTGIPPTRVDRVYGVMKPYMTRVGGGSFPTELSGKKEGKLLQEHGNEYGATTGRLRRCGWLDLVLAKYSIMLNGIDEIFLTKLDVLDHLDPIQVCTGYEISGELCQKFPISRNGLDHAKPIYKDFPGWKTSTRTIRDYSQLPQKAQNFLRYLENAIEVPISYVSVGPGRDETIRIFRS